MRSVSNGSAESTALEEDTLQLPTLRTAPSEGGLRSLPAAPPPQHQLVELRPTPSRALPDEHSDSDSVGAC